MMEQSAAAPFLGAEATSQHRYDVIKVLPSQIAIRPGLPHQFEEFVFLPILARSSGDDLLSQDIERLPRDAQAVQLAARNTSQQRRRFHQFIPAQRKQAAFGKSASFVLGPADALKKL